MPAHIYRYEFAAHVALADVESCLVLARLGAESLHGEANVQIGLSYHLDGPRRALVVDATSEIGGDFNRLVVGFLRREFGPDSFVVTRINGAPASFE